MKPIPKSVLRFLTVSEIAAAYVSDVCVFGDNPQRGGGTSAGHDGWVRSLDRLRIAKRASQLHVLAGRIERSASSRVV